MARLRLITPERPKHVAECRVSLWGAGETEGSGGGEEGARGEHLLPASVPNPAPGAGLPSVPVLLAVQNWPLAGLGVTGRLPGPSLWVPRA